MDRNAYSRALRAAAHVSFVALAGCASAENGERGTSSPATATSSRPSAPEASAAQAASTAAPPSCIDAGSVDGATIVSARTCEEKLKTAFPSGDTEWWMGQPMINDAQVAACCGETLANMSPEDFKALDAFRESGCCHVEAVPNMSTACTPWGPPMPPSMADWIYEAPVSATREPAWC